MALFGKKKNDDKKEDKKSSPQAAMPGGVVMPGSGKKDEGAKKKSKAKLKDNTGAAFRVLIQPLISEKGSWLAEENTYVFKVAKGANKPRIARAVADVYGVQPISVRIINVSGKSKQFKNVKGRTSDWKKALVTLPEGQKIDLYEGI